MLRRSLILIVQQGDFPGSLFIAGRQAGREAVNCHQHTRPGAFDQCRQSVVIWSMITCEPHFHICADITRNQVPVAGRRNNGRFVFLAVKIANETAHGGDVHR